MLPPPTLPRMRTVLCLALPAQSLTPVTCGLALCPGRDSLAFVALPPPPHIASPSLSSTSCQALSLVACSTHHLSPPHPPPASPSSPPKCGDRCCTVCSPHHKLWAGNLHTRPSLPCDLKQVTASCWASSPLKQRPRGLQKALSWLILKGSPDLLFQRPTKWHLFIYLFT